MLSGNTSNKKISPLTNILKANPGLITILKSGDLIEGIFVQKRGKAAYFDLGALGAGIVYGAEFSNAQDILKNLKAGDKVSAKVIEPENDEGYAELSLAEAGKQKAWQALMDYQEKGEIVAAKILGANAGGLIAEVNDIRGFVPVSQLAGEHYPKVEEGDRGKLLEELRKFTGQQLKVKVIDVNSRTNKLILSERETISENVKELLAKYKAGDVVDGIISGVADFGAFMRFVDNPKIEGLIYISELDYRIVNSPKEAVKIDEPVKAKILEIKDGRVSLSLKALKPDPWIDAEKKIQAGQEISGTAGHLYPYGALVNLENGLQGMVHVSEFGSLEEMKKNLEPGKSYLFKVELVKPAERRIILKLKIKN
jgi:small subunit ribosomal protein S1